ncbi:hypothetical protein ACFOZY_01225 [Chungangia koreensis]|uniref:YhfM-like domain-containing protein n=1 Tax=Chungangia koreensis TaxID=752657 RepID=A0ABV8X1T1_9LACT
MVRKLRHGMVICMMFVSLVACQNESGLKIEHSSVEFGSTQDRDDRSLHFRVSLVEDENVPKTDYNIRFVVEDSYIQELIGTDTVEVPDTYETKNGGGLVTGTSMPLAKRIDHDKLRKVIEKGKAVTVEVYHHDEVFDRQKVDLFRENIIPAATFSSDAKIETIDLTEANDIEQFKKAINGMFTNEYVVSVLHTLPDYQVNVGKESYYIWTDGAGKVMNVKDPYTLYSLSTQSLWEILELIGNKNELSVIFPDNR